MDEVDGDLTTFECHVGTMAWDPKIRCIDDDGATGVRHSRTPTAVDTQDSGVRC